jgi:hypothetical protein
MQVEKNKFESAVSKALLLINNLWFLAYLLFAILGIGFYFCGWYYDSTRIQKTGRILITPLAMIIGWVLLVLFISGCVNASIWFYQLLKRQAQKN